MGGCSLQAGLYVPPPPLMSRQFAAKEMKRFAVESWWPQGERGSGSCANAADFVMIH